MAEAVGEVPVYIALLRAVNVGGRWVRMAQLRDCLSDNGFEDVETHIQSGNVRVRTARRSSAKVEAAIELALAQCFGIEIPALVRTPAELTRLAREASALPSPLGADARRYVTFLRRAPDPAGAAALDAWAEPGERCQVIGRDVVLWLDKASHEAKLTNARTERLADTQSTSRDLKVVVALAEKWGA